MFYFSDPEPWCARGHHIRHELWYPQLRFVKTILSSSLRLSVRLVSVKTIPCYEQSQDHPWSFQNKSHCNFVILLHTLIIRVYWGFTPGFSPSLLLAFMALKLWASFEFCSYKAWPESHTKAD